MAPGGDLIDILLVEDNPADVRITQEAMKSAHMANRLHVARDGIEAMEFLRRQGPHKDAPRPELILLDINMPRMNGLEVLAEVKGDPTLRKIPVVVLTTSEAERDIAASYDLHANSYVSKPVDLDRFIEVVREIEEFWMGIVKLPRGP